MKLGLVQYSPIWENVEDNILKIEELLKPVFSVTTGELKPKVDLLIFPEMTLTGFTMDSEKFSEEIDGTGMRYFMNLAPRLKTEIIAGIIENDHGKIYNSLFHFDKLGLIKARYQKIHPFAYSGEDKSYTAGCETVITKIEKTQIGLSICYDLRFPELYRFYGKKRTDIIVDIANWPIPRIEHWKTLLKARAIENQCFMIGVNRVGDDPSAQYNGCSAVFGPLGEELLMAENSEGIFTADIEISRAHEVQSSLPFLADIKLI